MNRGERPIISDDEMVKAILDGRQAQARWVIEPQPDEDGLSFCTPLSAWVDTSEKVYTCPYGEPGDRLWVQESWALAYQIPQPSNYIYRADWSDQPAVLNGIEWSPSIHMPRSASRILLEITGIRAERLQDISEEDAIAEGVEADKVDGVIWIAPYTTESGTVTWAWTIEPIKYFATFWDSVNGSKPGQSWAANPWVWVAEFKKVEGE